jgi:hypothetical protein
VSMAVRGPQESCGEWVENVWVRLVMALMSQRPRTAHEARHNKAGHTLPKLLAMPRTPLPRKGHGRGMVRPRKSVPPRSLLGSLSFDVGCPPRSNAPQPRRLAQNAQPTRARVSS